MVSANTKMQDATSTPSQNGPPAYVPEGTPRRFPEGVYTLTNKKIKKLLSVSNGDIRPDTKCVGWPRNANPGVDHQLWVLKKISADETYRLMYLRGGTFLDLRAGNSENKTEAVVYSYAASEPSRLNQEWRISEEVPGYYTLQSARTETFLEMDGESTEMWRSVSCSSATPDRDLQLWSLERTSRTTLEIKGVMSLWKPDLISRLFQPYGDKDEYLVLPHELRTTIWRETKLLDQAISRNTFDYDDFVIKAKDAMNTWARDKLRISGYSVLFGIIFGTAREGPRAYNWYLSRDMWSLVFFDAQTGTEYTAPALDAFGFEPTFAMF